MTKKTLSFDEPSLAALSVISERERITMAEVVRRALRLYSELYERDARTVTMNIKANGQEKEMLLLVP